MLLLAERFLVGEEEFAGLLVHLVDDVHATDGEDALCGEGDGGERDDVARRHYEGLEEDGRRSGHC